MKKFVLCAATAALALALVGCGQQGSEVPAGSAPQQEQATEAPAAEAPAAEATAPGPVTFTDITGRADLYDQNVAKVAEAIDAIVGAVPAENPPTALVLTTFSGGTRVQSSGTQTGAMLADLGVNNLADENRSLLKDFSLEAVIEMDPDFIFVIPMGNDTEAAMRNLEEATAANPAWASLSAVQNGRYITLDPTLYLAKPNVQWDAAYQGLFDNLYGQN